MAKINEKLGTNYDLLNYYGAEDADRVIIAMGSICDVAEEVVDYLTAKGEKVGLVLVRLYRPWVSSALLKVLPKTVKKIAVLDRTKEPGSLGEPLYLDVATTLREAGMNDVVLTGGRYGLGSKDTPPSSVFAIYTELEKDAPKPRFTIGITDDVTNLSLPEVKPAPITSAPGTKECKFWVSAATVLSVLTRTPPRSSATILTSTFRLTSSMTPRRPVALPSAICVSATSPSAAPTTSTRLTSWLATTPLTSTWA